MLNFPLLSLHSASENLRQREEQASTYIRSRWRSYNTRNNFERLKNAVLSIQAGYRGHLGRKRALCRAHLVSSSQLFLLEMLLVQPPLTSFFLARRWRLIVASSTFNELHLFFSDTGAGTSVGKKFTAFMTGGDTCSVCIL